MAQQTLSPTTPTTNTAPTAGTDGVPYCTNAAVPTTEADLGDKLLTPAPIAVEYGQILIAVIQLSISGFITANNTYVVAQMDMGDGVWIDVAWIVWNQVQGTATFVVQAGVAGTSNNVFQNTRQLGSSPNPQASGSNAVTLAGRVRFTGQTKMSGGSSSPVGPSQVTATVKYKLLTPR